MHQQDTSQTIQPILHCNRVRLALHAHSRRTDLQTHPIEYPVANSHSHQSKEKGLSSRQSPSERATRAHAPVLLIVELGETENGSEREEQQHGIQKNESGYAQPRNVWQFTQRARQHPSVNVRIHPDAEKHLPQRTMRATKWHAIQLIPSSTAVYHPSGTSATPNVASMTRMAT